MDIIRQHINLSNNECVDILEIRVQHRLKFFSYTYWVTDKSGTIRPIIRWDNSEGQIHYDTYDADKRLFAQKSCEFKDSREILRLIKIFRRNIANMDISQL